MSRIEELRQPVRDIAAKFKKMGFKITDVTSIGLLLIKDFEANDISRYINLMTENPKDADAIVAAAEADSIKKKQTRSSRNVKSG